MLIFTLFPDKLLPVTSSLSLMLKKIPQEDLRYSMDGLECFAVQGILGQRIINSCA